MFRIVAALLASCVVMAAVPPADAAGRRWGEGYFPNKVLLDQNGRELRFYNDVVKGRIVVINFIYTSCTDICPLSTARMAQVAEQLGDRVGRDVFLVSLTVDPENDTPAKLKAYAEAYSAPQGWLFLTGSMENVRAVNAKLGERMRNLTDHRNEVVLGNDRTGEWARNSLFGDLSRLVLDINAMDQIWRDTVRKSTRDKTSDTGYTMSARPGEAMFKRVCAGCHAFKVGDRAGPDLYGVTQRREFDWLMRFMQDPAAVRKARDPIAMTLVERFPDVRMPRLGLTEIDARDLINYLETRAADLDRQRVDAEHRMSSPHGNHGQPGSHKTHAHPPGQPRQADPAGHRDHRGQRTHH